MKFKSILILVIILAVAGVTFLIVKLPNNETPDNGSLSYVWNFDMETIQHITLTLPREEKSESFIKLGDYFYFDNPGGLQVDPDRWGGGIPLLLSGPGADRLISRDTADVKLTEYGFTQPSLVAVITLTDGSDYVVELGDSNPSGTTYYIRLAESRDVYIVAKEWYDVLVRLVTEPPYVPASFVSDTPVVSPTEISAGETVTVSVTVINTGDVEGSDDIILYIRKDGEIIDTITKTVTLQGGATQVVTFEVTENTPGKYIVSIATRNASFVVK